MNLALGTFEHLGTRMPCEVIDLSLTGCCLKTREEFKAGALAHAKVTVPIDEMVQSIWELPSGEAGAHPWDQVIREMIEMDGKQSGV